MAHALDTAIQVLMSELHHEFTEAAEDFLTGERITEEKYLELLDDGNFEYDHPDGEWKIRFTPDHKVSAELKRHVEPFSNYQWYFQTPALNELIVIDVTEWMENRVGV